MDFGLLDVKSLINVNGIDVCFDYINTYYESNEAIKEAKLLSMNEDVWKYQFIIGFLKKMEPMNMLRMATE